MNRSSSRPSWYTAPRMTGVEPSAGNTHDCADGHSHPSTVAPSSRPPRISPIARGWRNRTNSDPIPCAHSRIAASAISV